jgi:5-methylcytosine-specific restriction endonuclease McrA
MTTYALLLNADFQPVRVLPARRALTLLLSGKAEPVEEGERPGVFRSSSGSVTVPAVLRLRSFVKIPYRATVPLNRTAVLARDNKTCAYCGKHGDTMDHVVPRARGGRHVWENVVAACKRCNAKKDDKLLSEIGWTLSSKPYAPKAWFYVVFKFELDPAWMPYLPQVAG